jgi:uncharacterized membrane protein (DUF2068 family)
MARHSDRILRLIGAFKLVKALSLVAVAVGALSLLRRDVAHGVRGWIDDFHPANHLVREAIEKISSADPHTLRMIGVGTLVYAALFLVEGIGLLLRKLWAEYVTTFITASLVPLEVYELVQNGSVMKALVVVANIAIVIYLVLRLRSDGQWPFRKRGYDAVAAASRSALSRMRLSMK